VRLRVARALWELGRFVPVVVTCALGLLVVVTLAALIDAVGLGGAILLSGIVMLAAGAVAAAISTAAKWLIVGPIRAGEQPLWSASSGAPRCPTPSPRWSQPLVRAGGGGTPALAVWLRSLGSTVGRGVWCDSYWLPEPDLVTLGDGSTVNGDASCRRTCSMIES
jgi:hypothetical protein